MNHCNLAVQRKGCGMEVEMKTKGLTLSKSRPLNFSGDCLNEMVVPLKHVILDLNGRVLSKNWSLTLTLHHLANMLHLRWSFG